MRKGTQILNAEEFRKRSLNSAILIIIIIIIQHGKWKNPITTNLLDTEIQISGKIRKTQRNRDEWAHMDLTRTK